MTDESLEAEAREWAQKSGWALTDNGGGAEYKLAVDAYLAGAASARRAERERILRECYAHFTDGHHPHNQKRLYLFEIEKIIEAPEASGK